MMQAAVAEVTKSSFAKEGIDCLIDNAGISTGKFKTATEGSVSSLLGTAVAGGLRRRILGLDSEADHST